MVREEDKPINNDKHEEETAIEFQEEIPIDEHIVNIPVDYAGLVSGWLAIISSVIAFFLLPVFFAIVAIVGGIIANFRHHATLGYTAITIAILAFIVRSFISPF